MGDVKKITKYFFAGAWVALFLWRLYIYLMYSVRYVDDDQAIMWYATVHFAHGHFPEPCFFGQDYNSMLEGLLAVPLYLCGWPLNYALPAVSSLLCFFTFLYCSIDCFRRGKENAAFVVILLFAMTAWQWDVLTSIPRPFVSAWTVIGAGLMCRPGNSSGKRLAGGFICTIGAVMTMSSVAILGIAVLDYIMQYKTQWKKYIALILGMIPAFGWYIFQKLYYTIHRADIITASGVDPMQKEAFEHSILNINKLFSETFGIGRIGVILIPCIICLAAICIIKMKQWRKLILLITAVSGCLFALSFGWMLVYDDCLLFGESRLVLYWVYLVLELILLYSYENAQDRYEHQMDKKKWCLALTIVSCFFLITKVWAFSKEVNNHNSTLYRSGVVSVMAVDELQKQSRTLVDLAENFQTDILITTAYSSVMAYGASSLYYDTPYVFYVPDRDRRVWVYNKLLEQKNSRMLLYSLPVDEDVELSIIQLTDKSVPEYFEETYGIERGGEYSWGIK